ncbi:superoxide dismutase family protein [Palleronia sp.]|uniref:superoxide dismutase family protein n=1 Tax=Palleronia sp. TaxID=1940284 RepID=UPI0035C7ED90
MLRTLLGTLSVAAITAMPAMAQQESGEAENAAEATATQDAGFVTAARASVEDRDGNQVGTVTINETLSGVPLVIVALNGVPSGAHGIHLHETGDCSAEDFTSAGGHIAGDAEHGVFAENGPHPGDLPNGIVDDTGALNVEYFVPNLNIEDQIFDSDGSAFVVHAGADDYISQPAGDSGDRIACGVFEEGN